MPPKITFTQKQYDALKAILDDDIRYREPLQALLDKMTAAREKETKAFHGVSVAKVHQLARDKFGDRYKTPSNITGEWTIRMQKAINSAGVDEQTAIKAVNNCNWTGDIFAQKFIYSLAELAVVAPKQQKLFGPPAASKQSGWLNRLSEDNE